VVSASFELGKTGGMTLIASAPIRLSDADREVTARQLGEHLAQGRLDYEDLTVRLDVLFAATTAGELDVILSDLPRTRRPATPLPGELGVMTPDERAAFRARWRPIHRRRQREAAQVGHVH
jgi:Domain of unknown function (DUF1707)